MHISENCKVVNRCVSVVLFPLFVVLLADFNTSSDLGVYDDGDYDGVAVDILKAVTLPQHLISALSWWCNTGMYTIILPSLSYMGWEGKFLRSGAEGMYNLEHCTSSRFFLNIYIYIYI